MTMMIPLLMLELPWELPWELFLHILTRLPLKYLMKLRCVSKFFRNLINNPNFITSYLLYCKSNPSPNNNNNLSDFNLMDTITLLHSSLSSPTPPDLCPSFTSKSKSNQLPWRFHVCFKGSNFIYSHTQHKLIPFRCPSKRLIDSMNGLVCFGGGYSLEIYNILAGNNYYVLTSPTRYFYPNSPNPCGVSCPIPNPIFAFGYDPISKDYKIPSFDTFTIYSLRTNSWTRMKMTRMTSLYYEYSSLIRNSRNVCVNGIIYWTPITQDQHDKAHYNAHYNGGILSYDLHRDIFNEIESPKEDIQLLSFRGCLAFACIKRTKTKSSKGKRAGGGEEGLEKTRGDMKVKLYMLKRSNGGGEGEENYEWINERFVVPISPPLEAEVVSYFDEIFLGWFESKQLRLYNLHSKCFFNLPLSQSSSDYYPKVPLDKKKKDPTYVNNLSFDFSLI